MSTHTSVASATETRNGPPCTDCGRHSHTVDANGHCFSLPAQGHTKPGFARVTTTRGQEVLARVTRETDAAVRELVSAWRIEVGGQPARNVIDHRDFGLTRETFVALCAMAD